MAYGEGDLSPPKQFSKFAPMVMHNMLQIQ